MIHFSFTDRDEEKCDFGATMSGVETASGDGAPQPEIAASPNVPAAVVRKTIVCFLCGGTQVYPGPRFENHLLNEHGVVFDLEFVIQLSLFKQTHNQLPKLDDTQDVKPVVNGNSGLLSTFLPLLKLTFHFQLLVHFRSYG